jgi:hypothetical protein
MGCSTQNLHEDAQKFSWMVLNNEKGKQKYIYKLTSRASDNDIGCTDPAARASTRRNISMKRS